MAAINLFATGLPLLSSVLQTATGMGGGVGERCPGNRLASGIPAGASVPRDNLGPAPKLALNQEKNSVEEGCKSSAVQPVPDD